MGLKIDNQSGKIVNTSGSAQLHFSGNSGPVFINVTGEIPLSNLLLEKMNADPKSEPGKIDSAEKPPFPEASMLSPEERLQLDVMNDIDDMYRRSNPFMAVEGVTGKPKTELNPGIRLRPSEKKPYHKAEHPEGTILHGIVFMVTIPEEPIGKLDIREAFKLTPGSFPEKVEVFLTEPAETYKIHTFWFEGKTITGVINEEDMEWDWKWDRPETIRKKLISYVSDIYNLIAEGTRCLKFRMCCAFAVGTYYIKDGKICGAAYDEAAQIHSGMDRLFTPLDTDYEMKYPYETKEFKESRNRHYCTSYSNMDYLDEGIIVGTRDIPFIGGYGNWYRPVFYNQYMDTAAVILYEKRTMPGAPVKLRVRLKSVIHGVKKKIRKKFYALKYRNLFKKNSLK